MLNGPNGPYCPMSGHAERACPGYPTPEHAELCRQGIGFSSIPGPDDQELLEEIQSDRELMLDEFHGSFIGKEMR